MRKFWRTMFLFVLLMSMATFVQASGLYEEGDYGQEVAQIQSQLISLGYRLGNADGDYGSMTTAAVKAFQKDRGLEVDGVIGAATYRALMGREAPVSRSDNATALVRRIIQTAIRYQGVPYYFGGTTPDGFDCSGFVRYVFARNGINLPRMADEQFDAGHPVSYGQLQPGDTVYFSTYTSGVSHVGIYIGDGKFISATSSRGVVIDPLDSNYWGPRYVGARRMM